MGNFASKAVPENTLDRQELQKRLVLFDLAMTVAFAENPEACRYGSSDHALLAEYCMLRERLYAVVEKM